MKTMKKFFASLLVLCMVLAMPNMAALANTTGTEENPEVITTLGGDATQAEGVNGYWYSYTAPSGGYLQITSMETTATDAYTAVKIINQTTQVETTGTYEKAYASAGDILLIQVRSYVMDDNWNLIYDAATITWDGAYTEAGTAEKPDSIEYIDQYTVSGSATVTPGQSGYYYAYTATEKGEVAFYLNEWMCDPADLTALAAEIVITNKTTNKTAKFTESTDTVEISMRGMTQSFPAVKMAVEPEDELVIEVASKSTTATIATVAWNAVFVYPEGAEANPIKVADGYDTENAFTTTVPAGQTYYYSLSTNYDGYQLTIAGAANCSVANVMGMEFGTADDNGNLIGIAAAMYGNILYAVTNNGTEDAELSWSFLAPEGSEGNPEEIVIAEGETTGSGEHSFTRDEAEYEYKYDYFFKWVATEDGYVRITVSANDEERTYNVWDDIEGTYVDVVVDGQVWYYYANNTAEDGDVIYSFSKAVDGGAVENGGLIAVEKGDVVVIKLQALDAVTGLFVDSTIKAEVEYVDLATGSEESAIKDIENHVPDTDDEGNPVETPATVILLDKDGNISGVITKEILEAAKENGVDIAFGVAEGVVWVIDADSLGDTLTDLDLSVGGEVAIPEELVTAIVGENDGYTVSIAHDGALGLDAILGLILGDENCDYTGMYANLFYYNETTGGLEFQDAYEMEDGHTAVFEMTHASDYVIVMTEEAMSADDNIIPATGDFSSTMIYVIVLLGAALVSAGFVAKKRFA